MTIIACLISGIVILAVLYMARDVLFADNVSTGTKLVFTTLSFGAVLIAVAFIRYVEYLENVFSMGF